MSLFSDLRRAFLRHGVRGSFELIPINLRHLSHLSVEHWFDRWYGIDTTPGVRGILELTDLPVIGDNRSFASPYAVTPYLTLFRLFRSLRLDPSRYNFVDFGSGRGRVLLIAAQHPFRQVVGVEFAPALHKAAEANISSYKGPRRCPIIGSLPMDVVDFRMPAGPCVLFFFNPFGRSVMERVAKNIATTFEETGDHIVIALYNQTVFGVLEAYSMFRPAYRLPEHPFDSFARRAHYDILVWEAGGQ